MSDFFMHFVSKHLNYIYFFIAFISFLESLMIIGLFLPGMILMSAIGTLIGNEKINFYSAWFSGVIGCLLGDWISYFIGFLFKNRIDSLTLFKKYGKVFTKIQFALNNYSSISIFFGKLIGPIRPLVPMLSGMLKIPIKKFIFPNLLGCIIWPVVYFLPGIIAGAVVNYPEDDRTSYFKWIFLTMICMYWVSFWFFWKWWKWIKSNCKCESFKFLNKSFFLALLCFVVATFSLLRLISCPDMLILKKIFFKICKFKKNY